MPPCQAANRPASLSVPPHPAALLLGSIPRTPEIGTVFNEIPTSTRRFQHHDPHQPSALDTGDADGVGAVEGRGFPRPEPNAARRRCCAFAIRLEQLGYGALWVPEAFGHESFTTLAYLAAHTERLGLATGIANIWLRSAGTVAQASRTISEQSHGRFVLGLGVGHRGTMVDVRRLSYDKPLEHMRRFLEDMDEAPWYGPAIETSPPRLLAALGPKMLELAGSAADGAQPFLTTPEHTEMARTILGPDKLVCVGQQVIVGTNAAAACGATISRALDVYRDPTNYRNNWLRLGFSASDIDDRSNRFLDALVPWGPASAALERIREHYEAARITCASKYSRPRAPTSTGARTRSWRRSRQGRFRDWTLCVAPLPTARRRFDNRYE